MKTKTLSIAAALLTAACGGSSQKQETQNARIEKTEAQATAQQKNVEHQAEEREEHAEKAYDKQNERISESDQPGAKSSEDLNDLAKDRTEYQINAEKRSAELGVQIQEAQQKIGILGGQAPTSLRTDLQTAKTEHDTLQRDLSDLRAATPDQWDSVKARVERDRTDLDMRVSKLQDKIDDVMP